MKFKNLFTFDNKSSAVAELGDRGHNKHGPKRQGAAVPISRGKLGPRLIQCGLSRGLLPYQVAFHPSSRLATIDMDRKLGGCAPFRGSCDPI